MRLINTSTLELHEFNDRSTSDFPKYAILTHTWGDEEVTFQDITTSSELFKKKGFMKIKMICELASKNNLEYAWVDTCCIDKSSSAELSEAINSMYAWYRDSTVCYAFLEDLEPATEITRNSDFAKCRWFKRGWTLQELIAPRCLEFYDKEWGSRGSKKDYAVTLEAITRIPAGILNDESRLSDISVAERMSWASSRETSRIEDQAYCLLGIFGIHIPLIYGEGSRSFRRLQEEIIKSTGDMTNLAWGFGTPGNTNKSFQPLFAPNPSCFVNTHGISALRQRAAADMTITTRGLCISRNTWFPLLLHGAAYYLLLGVDSTEKWLMLSLSKIGPGLFARTGISEMRLDASSSQGSRSHNEGDYYILIDVPRNIKQMYVDNRNQAIQVDSSELLPVEDALPHSLWDQATNIFLRNRSTFSNQDHPMTLVIKYRGSGDFQGVRLVVLLDLASRSPALRILHEHQAPRLISKLFNDRNRENSLIWADLEDSLDAARPRIGESVIVPTATGCKSITPVLGEGVFVPSDFMFEVGALRVDRLHLRIV
ncbi:putative vegetative incompatibility protein HET [Cercophora samala]|uniref:Vegetative incompatibility protein HET n=1 Tax=Cercophora samala TaxID=330535 RepID=A0AA40D9D8_9PEZI|nr:putative vegetative incompatibility protein HET [Cercophora samala]